MKNEIEKLQDNELILNLDTLVTKEGTATIEVLKHLWEVERRKLHFGLGYGSLFSYCTERLKYSEGGANRRIKGARCIGAYPEVLEALTKRTVTLSTICIFESVLTKENVDRILALVLGRSQAEVERIISGFKPEVRIKDSIKPIFVAKTAEVEISIHKAAQIEPGIKESSSVLGPIDKPKVEEAYRRSGGEERVKFTFSATVAFHEKFKEVKALISSKYPKGASFEEVFEKALEEYLKRHSSKRKEKREHKCSTQSKSLRYIPSLLREKVMRRDSFCCSFIGVGGRKCGSIWDLEIDHIQPIGMGGETSLDNLRVLCSAHNRFQAETHFGPKKPISQRVAS